MIRFLPLVLPLFLIALFLGFYWGRNHQRRMNEIEEPDDPQIFSDGGVQVKNEALSAADIEQLSDEEIEEHLDEPD